MKLHRKSLGWVLILALAGTIVALAFRKSDPGSHAIARIGYLNITASLPFFIAQEKRFFEDLGVRVEPHQVATSNQLVDGIVADNLDVFVEASAAPVLAVEQQSPGRLKIFSVSAITADSPFDALLVTQQSAIGNLQDLAGKKIGVFPGSTATSLLKKFLNDQVVDTSNIAFVAIPPPSQLSALVSKNLDAVHAYEPTTSIALRRSDIRKLYGSVYAAMLDRNPQGVAGVSGKFLKSSPGTAEKVIEALERAILFMRTNEAEARGIMATKLQLEPEVAAETVFLNMVPLREIDVDTLQKYADMLTALGELKGSINVAELIYRQSSVER